MPGHPYNAQNYASIIYKSLVGTRVELSSSMMFCSNLLKLEGRTIIITISLCMTATEALEVTCPFSSVIPVAVLRHFSLPTQSFQWRSSITPCVVVPLHTQSHGCWVLGLENQEWWIKELGEVLPPTQHDVHQNCGQGVYL